MADNSTPETVAKAEYDKVVERAQRFEGQLATLQKDMERFKGIDPDKYKATLEDYENLRKDAAGGDKAKIEKLLADKEDEYKKRYGTKYEELETRATTAEKELKKLRVTNVAMQKAAGIFTEDSLAFVEHAVEAACEWSDGGIVVKGADGKPEPSKKDPRKNMSLEEFLEDFANAHPSIAKSGATGGTARGGNTRPASGTGGALDVEAYRKMSKEDRAKLDPATRFKLSQENLRR